MIFPRAPQPRIRTTIDLVALTDHVYCNDFALESPVNHRFNGLRRLGQTFRRLGQARPCRVHPTTRSSWRSVGPVGSTSCLYGPSFVGSAWRHSKGLRVWCANVHPKAPQQKIGVLPLSRAYQLCGFGPRVAPCARARPNDHRI